MEDFGKKGEPAKPVPNPSLPKKSRR
jgi:hypothetical protein